MKQDHSDHQAGQIEIIQEGSVQDQCLIFMALAALAALLWYGFRFAGS